MLEYEITARRTDSHSSVVHCKQAELVIDGTLGALATVQLINLGEIALDDINIVNSAWVF